MSEYPAVRGIIFDVDGVLCDSEALIREAVMRMFREEYGVEVKEEDFRPYVGAGEDRFIGGPAEKYGVKLEMPGDKQRVYGIYLEIIKGRLKEVAGAGAYVRKAKERGLKVAVATSADRVKMEGNLREVGMGLEMFDAIVSGSDVAKKKPDPEVFLLAAKRLGLSNEECWVVEDAINGVQAAVAAGSRCLGISTSFAKEDLLKNGAELVAANFLSAPLVWEESAG